MYSSMKKRSFQRRNALLSSTTRIWGGVLGACTLIILGVRFFSPDLFFATSSSLFAIGSNLGNALYASPTIGEDPVTVLRERDRLLNDVAALRIERDTLQAKVTDLTRFFREQETAVVPGILAGVLSNVSLSPYDTFLVDRGSANGVVVHAVVYGPGGVPIGTVADVGDTASRIILYSEAGRKTTAWLGEDRLALTLTGLGSGTFEGSMSKEAGSRTGMIVYVPGPGAIAFGEVVSIDMPVAESNVILHIRPFVNPFSLTWVSIAPTP
jgi:hypothetical protein